MMWHPFDPGSTIGARGTESGVIIRDEEHANGARITLEKDGYQLFGITCGIYGLMVHTAFAADEEEAFSKYEVMRRDMGEFLTRISASGISEDEACALASEWCAEFSGKY